MLLPGLHRRPLPPGRGRARHDPVHAAPHHRARADRVGDRRVRRQHPDRDWVLGGGWSMGDFPGGLPTREELDAVVADRPVALTNRDFHGMWVNSRALEVAGITDSTPDPEGGRIERDASGRATGMLQEQAMHLVVRDRAGADARRPHRRHPPRAGLLPRPRHHVLGRRAGRRRRAGGVHRARSERRSDDARARHAGLGSGRRHRPAGRADRAPRSRHRRAAELRRGQVLPRRRVRELHRRHDRALPRCERRADLELRPRPVRPRRPDALRAGLRRRRVPGAHPRARQPRRARVPRHLRARHRGQRPARRAPPPRPPGVRRPGRRARGCGS